MEVFFLGRKPVDLTGQKFHELTVIKQAETLNKSARWHCVCSCGNKTISLSYDLRHGKAKSCGCKRGEYWIETMGTHGMTNTKLYRAWWSMISRCEYAGDSEEWYKDKGISVSREWRENFMNFYEWAIKNGYKEGLSIDRIDNDKNYTPENCRWGEPILQQHNKSNTVRLNIKGREQTIMQWSKETGVSEGAIRNRLQRGKTGIDLIKSN